MKCFRIFLIISMAVCPTVLWADIYRFVDGEGVVHFSNTQYDGNYELYLREGVKAPPPSVSDRASSG